jgi:DNA polymerase-4
VPAGIVPACIVHLDLDAFYAAVEVIENEELEGKPIVIGGRPEQRGVVATASYPARDAGIRSAMPMARAVRLCPQVIILPPRHQIYHEYSRQVMAILHQVSPQVEQTSIDEAYLDLTEQIAAWEQGVEIARALQARVQDEVGLSASLGVATNKLVAKVASDRDKPGGLTIVQPGEEATFLAPLPVRVLWGIGPVTAGKLAEMGIATVGDLARIPAADLQARFGKHGRAMARQAQGIDERQVQTEREVKSISQERTFARDLVAPQALTEQLERLSAGVSERLRAAGLAAGTIAVKLRYADFTTVTRQAQPAMPTNDVDLIHQTVLSLWQRAWQPGRAVRLLGVAGRRLVPAREDQVPPPEQLSLFTAQTDPKQ